jgi:hypothetical protein
MLEVKLTRDLDAALPREARRARKSKAALVLEQREGSIPSLCKAPPPRRPV